MERVWQEAVVAESDVRIPLVETEEKYETRQSG
jgi:hypothetical protein